MGVQALRVGILGGTFDPFHEGHARLAVAACPALGLDLLLLVPARLPPHKRGRRVSPAPLRLRIARLAARDLRRIGLPARADPLELRMRGLSYTVRTLRALRKRYGQGARLFLILGSDELALFPAWREPAGILELATLAVAERPGDPYARTLAAAAKALPGLKRPGARVRIPMRPTDISATEIRRPGPRGRAKPTLPPSVARHLRRRGLYR